MRKSFVALAAGACLWAMPALAETVPLHATLDAAHEVPAKTSAGKGSLEGTLDTTTRKLTYTVTWSGLSGPATAAHFHGPAAAGANAGVVVAIDKTSPSKGEATLTEPQMQQLMDGLMYVNVHTAANPGGEIRGQVEHGK